MAQASRGYTDAAGPGSEETGPRSRDSYARRPKVGRRVSKLPLCRLSFLRGRVFFFVLLLSVVPCNAHFLHESHFTLHHFRAQGSRVYLRLLGLAKHTALFLLDVMVDLLAEDRYLRVVEVIVRRRALELRDQVLRSRMLHQGLVHKVRILDSFADRGIKDFLLDRGMNLKFIANLCDDRSFVLVCPVVLELGKLGEQCFDFFMIRLKKANCGLLARRRG